MFCKVAFPVPLDKEFDYEIDDSQRPCAGMRVRTFFGPIPKIGVITAVSSERPVLPEGVVLKKIMSLPDTGVLFPPLLELGNFIKKRWGSSLGMALELVVPQFVAETDVQAKDEPKQAKTPLFALSPEQAEASAKITDAVCEKRPSVFLLFGDCSTGKTEILKRLAASATTAGRQVLVLAPDIFMAEKLAAELAAYSQSEPLLWHSKITTSRRKKVWASALRGAPRIFVGTRSACLLPLSNAAFVAIEEEQDESYKQEDSRPFYHARDILLRRAETEHFPLVLSSAVPSLESLRLAVDGQYEMLRLKTPQNAVRPQTMLCDKHGEKSKILSDRLLDETDRAVMAGKNALFIINRTGYASACVCLNCLRPYLCKKCGGPVALHKGKQEGYFCLRCGTEAIKPFVCPHCKNSIFRQSGGGTQKAVSELDKFFPDAGIIRFDAETVKNKSGEGRTVTSAFTEGMARFAVGTRLLSRGTALPNLGIAAVIDADTEFSTPDFRAGEKTCQMLMQTKGRLTDGGVFIIQTNRKDDECMAAAASGGYMEFALKELQFRKELNYPPYCRLVRFEAEAKNDDAAAELCNKAADLILAATEGAGFAENRDFELLGPAKCGGKTTARAHLIMKTRSDELITLALRACDAGIKVRRPVIFRAVADPYDFH